MNDLEELRREGIVVVNAESWLDDPRPLGIEFKPPVNPSGFKPFFCTEYIDHPTAHDKKLVGLIGDYYGQAPQLRETRLVQTIPTPGEPIRSQLWHRDPGRVKIIVAFMYLNDVTMENSPFCYVRGTHRMGRYSNVEPLRSEDIPERQIRITDAEMRKAIPESQWLTVTGPRNTLIIADTLGYHRGLKPVSGSRLALMFIYRSPK